MIKRIIFKYKIISNFKLISLLILILFSCEKKYDWSPTDIDKELIVVEAHFTNIRGIQEIRISKVYQDINGGPQPTQGAEVFIQYLNTTVLLQELQPGVYFTDSNFQAVINIDYELKINYNEEVFTANAYSLAVNDLKVLTVAKTEDSTMFHVTNVAPQISNEEAMYEVFIDWSHLPGYDTLSYNQTHALFYEYSLSSIDEHQIFSAGKQNLEFPENSVIIEKKYSLTPEHAAYIRALLSETDWRGSAFDVAPANLPSNISGGVLGFFGLSSVVSDTIIVK